MINEKKKELKEELEDKEMNSDFISFLDEIDIKFNNE